MSVDSITTRVLTPEDVAAFEAANPDSGRSPHFGGSADRLVVEYPGPESANIRLERLIEGGRTSYRVTRVYGGAARLLGEVPVPEGYALSGTRTGYYSDASRADDGVRDVVLRLVRGGEEVYILVEPREGGGTPVASGPSAGSEDRTRNGTPSYQEPLLPPYEPEAPSNQSARVPPEETAEEDDVMPEPPPPPEDPYAIDPRGI